MVFLFFFFNDTAPTEIYTLPLHDALPIWLIQVFERDAQVERRSGVFGTLAQRQPGMPLRLFDHPLLRSEEHTSELQAQSNLVCRLLLEKKNYHSMAHKPCTDTTDSPSDVR